MSTKIHERMVVVADELSPVLANALTRTGPIRLQRRWRSTPLVDVLCRAVAGQQLSVLAARTIWGRVLEGAGDQSLAEYLPDASSTALRACGLSAAKAKAMRSIVDAAEAGELDPDGLRALSHADRSARLTEIWGVGQWTADMIGIFYFGNRDVWPDGDVTARKTLARLTSKRRKTVLTAERFAPYRSYLAMHMWRHAHAAPA